MSQPISYAISSGEATDQDFETARIRITDQAKMLAEYRVSYFQIREKRLSASNLYRLAEDTVRRLEGSSTRLLINDRADIAAAVGAFGIHLTETSLPAKMVKQSFGDNLAIFVSTHSSKQIRDAELAGASVAVFGPIFPTPGKSQLAGLEKLSFAVKETNLPVLALGGVDDENFYSVMDVGAAGVAGIRIFADEKSTAKLMELVNGYE
jgi:thiamine-phosphate diphosphorylase